VRVQGGPKNCLINVIFSAKKVKIFLKSVILFSNSPIGPYKQFRASGIEFDFADPHVSYVAQDTGEEVLLPIDPSQLVPPPELILGEKNELQIAVRLFLELVVLPAANSSSANTVLRKSISYMESLLMSTSGPNQASIPNRTETRKRSQSEVKSSKKSKKN
jgi:hypothetical protein